MSRVTVRRLALPGAVAAALAVGLLVLDQQTRTDVLTIAGPAVVAAGFTLVLLDLRAVKDRITRHQRQVGDSIDEVGRRQSRHGALLKDIGAEVAAIPDLAKAQADSRSRLNNLVQAKDLAIVEQRLIRAGRTDTRQIEAYLQLMRFADLSAPTPGTRGWAASPDHLLILCRQVRLQRPRVVVDLGSGLTTLWMALVMLADEIPGRIISVDHDASFLATTGQLLSDHGVDHLVDLRLASLTPWRSADGTEQPWYDTAALSDLEAVDLVSIDGPPETTCALARYPALPVLADALAAGAVVVLDDAKRSDEHDAVARWLSEYPRFEAELIDTEKGTVVLCETVGHPSTYD